MRHDSSKLILDRVVPQKSTQDSGKDDETTVAVDTGSRH